MNMQCLMCFPAKKQSLIIFRIMLEEMNTSVVLAKSISRGLYIVNYRKATRNCFFCTESEMTHSSQRKAVQNQPWRFLVLITLYALDKSVHVSVLL